jgi:hypothetical protein
MVYQRLVPIPVHRLNRLSSNGRVPQRDNVATEQRLTQLERDNATLVAASRRDNRLSHFIGIGALVVAAASAWGGYQFNTWQQNKTTELAASQDAQDKLAYSAFLNMACVLQAQQAVAELQYRPQAASQIFDALRMNEAKCQAVGVPLTARAAWLVVKHPERLESKIVERAKQAINTRSSLTLAEGNQNRDLGKFLSDIQGNPKKYYTTQGYADLRIVSAVDNLTEDKRDFLIQYQVEPNKYEYSPKAQDNTPTLKLPNAHQKPSNIN